MNTYARVLITGLPHREFINESGRHFSTPDGSALPFIVEEIISRSATHVALIGARHHAHFVESLSPILRDRVVLVDPEQAQDRLRALVSPVLEEFDVSYDHGMVHYHSPLEKDLSRSISHVLFSMDTFFIGLSNHLQIDIHFNSLVESVRLLRERSRRPDSRGVLAVVEGILGSYVPVEVPSLQASPEANPQLVELFHRLVQDQAYLHASEGSGGLGVFGKAKRSIEQVRRGLSGVLRKPAFAKLFNFSTKAVSTASSVQLPDTELIGSLLERNYLPPVISLADPLNSALRSWAQDSPEIVRYDPDGWAGDAAYVFPPGTKK